MEQIKMVDRASYKRATIDRLVSKYAGSFRKKKLRYSEEEKAVISSMLHDAEGNFRIVAEACRICGLCSLDISTLQRIQKSTRAPPGKPVNKDFEKLVVSIVRSQTPSGNVTSAMLRTAAKRVKQEYSQFQKCPIVQRLQFSRKWVHGIWHRYFVLSNQCGIQCHKTEI
jgi:hypothetical protein